MCSPSSACTPRRVMPPTDQFYGERSCRLRDPFGHTWLVGREIEKLSPEGTQRRYTALFASG